MISAQSELLREPLIERLMHLPNVSWDQNITLATRDLPVFIQDYERVKQVTIVLKTNVAACTSIGHPFIVQLGRIFLDLLGLYKGISELISQLITTQGLDVIKTPQVKQMRAMKKETLKLLETWLGQSADPVLVMANFASPLLEVVLADYRASVPAVREPEVLRLLATLLTTMRVLFFVFCSFRLWLFFFLFFCVCLRGVV